MKLQRVVVFLLFVFSGLLAAADNGVLVENLFRNADRHIKSGNFSGARSEYEKLKGFSFPEYAREFSLLNIAESYRLEKDYNRAHKTFGEIFSLPGLTAYYLVYGLFRQAEVYTEEKDYRNARKCYEEIAGTEGALEHHVFKAGLYTGDTYRRERKYKRARTVYKDLLTRQDASPYPHESYRLELADRLEEMEGLADGQEEKSRRTKRAEWVNKPGHGIYVAPEGSDNNRGTKESPFASIQRARAEVRRIKGEKGIPEGGIAVYLRKGRYFLTESVIFGSGDSGEAGSPVVYRSYPGEEVRLIGGRELTGFRVLADPGIIRRLPEESRGKVWVADLKEAGITGYGYFRNRGAHHPGIQPGAMELFYNTGPMQLARWPDGGWERVVSLTDPGGMGIIGGIKFQKGKFSYSGARPERWEEEKDIWAVGYFMRPWNKLHARVFHIDTRNRVVHLAPDIRWSKGYISYDMPVVYDAPYYFYNILSEISVPGEYYIDRDKGMLYFYPPGSIDDSEIIVSTLDAPVIEMKDASHIVVFGLTVEAAWRSGITVTGGQDNLVAGCTIRNTGNMAVVMDGGWRNGVVGCDIYDTGEGGIRIRSGNSEKLISGGHYAENNHIYRFNRVGHGASLLGVVLSGVGNRVAHNLISDASYIAVNLSGNNHVVEYNEIYDVMHEGRDGGAIYSHGGRFLMNRGNVIRHNFIHHITHHSSPLKTHQVTGLYIDGFNAGVTMEGNIFYRCTERAMFTHGPDTRIENNVFADSSVGITQSNRTYLLREEKRARQWEDNLLNIVKYRQPPWAARYPRVRNILDKKPIGAPEDIVIERNIFSKTPPIRISGDFIYADNIIRNNFEEGSVFFRDRENMDFRLRVGSPVFGVTGSSPLPFEKIGLYEDPLRASWPAKRLPAGKYYTPGWTAPVEDISAMFPRVQRVSRAKEYTAARRESPIIIDGILKEEEWLNLDKEKAIAVNEEHLTGVKRKGAESFAWILYDSEYLYIGVEHMPDKWEEGLPEKVPVEVHEIAIEGDINQDTWWWQEGLPAGPLYVFSGRPDGRFAVPNLFNMPGGVISRLQQGVEYRAVMLDSENYHWTAEWKIPLALLNIDIKGKNMSMFNVGVIKRAGWFAWVATGTRIWRVDNAGLLKFAK